MFADSAVWIARTSALFTLLVVLPTELLAQRVPPPWNGHPGASAGTLALRHPADREGGGLIRCRHARTSAFGERLCHQSAACGDR